MLRVAKLIFIIDFFPLNNNTFATARIQIHTG